MIVGTCWHLFVPRTGHKRWQQTCAATRAQCGRSHGRIQGKMTCTVIRTLCGRSHGRTWGKMTCAVTRAQCGRSHGRIQGKMTYMMSTSQVVFVDAHLTISSLSISGLETSLPRARMTGASSSGRRAAASGQRSTSTPTTTPVWTGRPLQSPPAIQLTLTVHNSVLPWN